MNISSKYWIGDCYNYCIFATFPMETVFSIGLSGENCLFRAICEIAEVPMHIEKKHTLLEHMVHYALT